MVTDTSLPELTASECRVLKQIVMHFELMIFADVEGKSASEGFRDAVAHTAAACLEIIGKEGTGSLSSLLRKINPLTPERLQ